MTEKQDMADWNARVAASKFKDMPAYGMAKTGHIALQDHGDVVSYRNIKVTPDEDFYLTIPKRKKKMIKAILEYKGPIEAPVKKGDKVGLLNVYLSDELIKQINILAAEDVKRSNIFSRIFTSLNYLVWGDV